MTNCNYSEHTKIQRKEIQKQIEELQAKLEELENPKLPVEIAFKDNYGVYPNELNSNDDFNCWVSFKRGYTAAKQDKIVEQLEEIDWKSVALCFGEELVDVGPDGYYDFTPAQWLEWTKKVYKRVVKPEELKSLWNRFYDAKWSNGACDEFCEIVEQWLYANSTTVEEDHHTVTLKLKKGMIRESND